MITLIGAYCAALAGAIFYRMRGGSPSWPRPIEQCLYCLIYGMTLAIAGVPWWAVALGYAASVAFCCTGHGQYMSLGKHLAYVKPERFDALLWPFGADPRNEELPGGSGWHVPPENAAMYYSYHSERYGLRRLYWRCVAGLWLTGTLVTYFPGVILAFNDPGNPAFGALLAFSGGLKAPAYMLSHRLGWGTEGGEYMTGALCWLSAFALCVGVAA